MMALLQAYNLTSFMAGLAALLAIYDISKVTPAMDPPVESMLLDLSIFYWMATMEIQDEDVSEHLDPYGKLFLPALNQLFYCENHHPRINLDEVQQVFPDVPREIWQVGTTYKNINEDFLLLFGAIKSPAIYQLPSLVFITFHFHAGDLAVEEL